MISKDLVEPGGGCKWRHNVAHTSSLLDKQGYMHARVCLLPRAEAHARTQAGVHKQIYHISCFSTAKMIRERALILRYTYIVSHVLVVLIRETAYFSEYRWNSGNITLCTPQSRRLRWAGHVASMGKRRVAYRDLVRKPEGRRPLGKTRRRWKDNIKIILERGSNSVHTVHGARPASYTISTRSFSLGSKGQHRLE
jgi:hypothetical protein